MAARAALALLVLLAPALASRAAAQAGCPDALRAWASRCEGAGAQPVSCPDGHVILGVAGGLRVDVTATPRAAFARAGSLGLSPIGRFESWDAVPAPQRAGFDALVACARREPSALLAAIESAPLETARGGTRALPPRRSAPPVPWRLALGLVLLVALAVRRAGPRGAARGIAAITLAGAVVLALRSLLVPESYFHQNGQGPFWVSLALGAPSEYGPGYAELFQSATRWVTDDPERGLLLAQAALAALVPPLAASIVRDSTVSASTVSASTVNASTVNASTVRASTVRASTVRASTVRASTNSVSTLLAGAAGLAVALSPTLARLARSESYLASCGALIVLAAAVLATFARADAPSRERVVASVAAGLVLAQAARVHPVSWVPCALVPLVVLVGRGEARERLRATTLAAGVVLGVVALAAGPALVDVLEGSLGAHWRGELGGRGPRLGGVPGWIGLTLVAGIGSTAAAIRSRAARRAGLAGAVVAGTVLAGWGANILDPTVRGVHAAYASLFLAPVLAGLAALLDEASSRWPRLHPRALSVGALGLALLVHARSARDALEPSTDAREAALVRTWRARLPSDAAVLHLARAGQHVAIMPIYDTRSVPVSAEETPLPRARGYYLRTSLCSTAAGRAACEALERDLVLEPVETATLPAIPSVGNLPYDRAQVEIGLHRVW